MIGLERAKVILRKLAPREHRLLFAFPGGTGAWPEMGRALFREHAVFRDSIERTSDAVESVLGWRAVASFRGDPDPAVTAEHQRRNDIIRLGMLQIAQVDLWRAEGIVPGGVLSLSLGEMVAPYAAGAITREDSARIVAGIARLASLTSRDEWIFIVRATRDEARRLATSAPVPVDYLGSMTPGSAVLLTRESDAATVREFLGTHTLREIATEWNYHTPKMDVDREWLDGLLPREQTRMPVCPVYSSAVGALFPPGAPFNARFFAWMASRPFHYSDALRAALLDGFDAIVAMGSAPVNNIFIQQTAASVGCHVEIIDSMHADDERRSWREAVRAVRSLRIVPPRRKVVSRAFDPGDEDRFAWYEELRLQGTVHHVPHENYWLVLGYDEVQRALGDPAQFSSRVPDHQHLDSVLLGADPPQHTVARRVLSRYFSPEAVARYVALAARTADRLLQPLAGGAEIDVVADFAAPWAERIATEIVGLRPDPTLVSRAVAEAGGDLMALYANMREPAKAECEQSALYMELRRDGFDDEEARSLMVVIWVAALTPKHAVAPAVLLLLADEEVRRSVQDDPSLTGAFIDETLRLHPPTHLLPRRTTRDVNLDGTIIREGEIVQLCLAAANRDPRRFAEPGTLRLDRSPNAHLSFGGGVHRCLGASLARGMLVEAIRALFRVAPQFHAVQPLSTVRYAQGTTLRQIEQLVIGA